MWEWFAKKLDRFESRIALAVAIGSVPVSAITAYLTSLTEPLAAYSPLSYWAAILCALLIVSLIALAFSWTRKIFLHGSAIKAWQERTSYVKSSRSRF